MADNKDEIIDQEVPALGDYNEVVPPLPKGTTLEEYYKNQPVPPMPTIEDQDDGKAHKNLNFDSSALDSRKNAVMSLLGRLGQQFQNNLRASDEVNKAASAVMNDRLKMKMNPTIQGPPVPNEPLPAEQAQVDMIGQGVMGSLAPAGKVIAKSAPWMKNLAKETVEAAVPKAEGLVNAAGDSIAKQAAIAQQKFRALQKYLGK